MEVTTERLSELVTEYAGKSLLSLKVANTNYGFALINNPTLTEEERADFELRVSIIRGLIRSKGKLSPYTIKDRNPLWTWTGERCPKCGERMIENNRYIECGGSRCDYIEKAK